MIFLFILLAFILFFNLLAFLLSAPRYKGPVSDHFDGKRFINPGNFKAKGLTDVIHWMATRKPGKWLDRGSDYGIKPLAISESLRVTFINHTTFLIQVNKVNILTDPVWSKRVSPFSFAGPKRKRLPGIKFTDLPKIDVVLLSHNHYDHLDIHTVKELARIHQCRFIVPLGVKAFLDLEKIDRVEELDWWKTSSGNVNGIGFQSVPAQHFSGRGGFDRDATLWCGYVIHTPLGKIYFAGDTGYNNKTFKLIGQELGPFKLSLIPIGAYKPSWFMSPIHCSPEEAVYIHKDVQSSLSIATHFGTFPLADDGYEDPIHDFERALLQNGVATNQFIIPQEGVPIDLK